ncbi:MAG TPA: signal peptidase I [Oscillospiraceae bacterium]|nr:signal peptidase I [Oscillospiraceae bacterium]
MKHNGENSTVNSQGQSAKEFTQSSGVLNCFEWVESIVTALIIVVVIFTFLFRIVTVSGSSMEPNLYDSYRLILTNFNYQPKQGDVVVISHTVGLSEPIIKRVIALPGQTVNIDNATGRVSVDGKILDESAFIQNGITHVQGTSGNPVLKFPQKVPAGHIFVLGDNRLVSEDSRYTAVGMVDEKTIIGKAELILFPFNHIGKIG